MPAGLRRSGGSADNVRGCPRGVTDWCPGARTHGGQRRRSRRRMAVFAQVRAYVMGAGAEHCKTVGSAYVGSNPTPATTCENGPLAAETQPGGPFPSRHVMYQGASLRVDAWQWLRTYSGQRPGKTSGAYNRSLRRSVPVLSRYPAPRRAGLTGIYRASGRLVLRRPACDGRRAGLVRPAAGQAAGSARAIPLGAAAKVAIGCAPPPGGRSAWRRGGRRWDPDPCAAGAAALWSKGSRCRLLGLDPAEPHVPAVDW